MERGRYTHYSTHRTPKRARRISIPGSFEDKGKYLRCWNCGFIVDVDRDCGDSERSGNYETDFTIEAGPLKGSGSTPYMELDGLNMIGTMIINGPNGDPITDYYTPRLPQSSRGCKFCGVTNFG